MKSLEHWLFLYQQNHQHPINIAIHKIAVPAIVFSIFGLLWALPFPFGSSTFFNWGTIVAVVVFFYYLFLSIPLSLVFLVVIFLKGIIIYWIDNFVDVPLWIIMSGIFIIAWLFQFIGHGIEGKRPSFSTDLRFLLVGPLWILALVFRKLPISKLAKK